MRHSDPWKCFENPKITELVHVILSEDVSVRVGIAIIRNRTYAIPMIWDTNSEAYNVLAITDMLGSGNPHRLSALSKVDNYLRDRLRDRRIYLLINGVANLNHDSLRKQ